MCDGRFFVFKQKTADEMRISDWSSDVCASDREAVARAFPEAVILRSSVVFGPQDGFFSRFAGLAQMTPVLPLFGCRPPRRQDGRLDLCHGGGTKFQAVYVVAVADAVIEVLSHRRTSRRTHTSATPHRHKSPREA